MVRCARATSGNPAGYGRRAKLRWAAAVPGMCPHTVRRAAPVTVFLPGEKNLGLHDHQRLKISRCTISALNSRQVVANLGEEQAGLDGIQTSCWRPGFPLESRSLQTQLNRSTLLCSPDLYGCRHCCFV